MAKTEKTVKQLRQEKREKEEKERLKFEKRQLRLNKTSVDASGTAALGNNPKKMALMVTAAVLAVVIIAVSIVMIVIFSNPYRDSKYPVAVITMSDNRKLVFQLYDDEAPVAVAVFHYYAYHGYYNGTIIDSVKSSSLKMGGYEDSRALLGNQAVVKMLQKSGSFNQPSYKFYMKDDTTANRSANQLGALSTIKVSSSLGASAEFQISAADEGLTGAGADQGRCFGMAYDQKTKDNLLYYRNNLKLASDTVFVQADSVVSIKKIKFYNAGAYKSLIYYNDDFKNVYVGYTTRA